MSLLWLAHYLGDVWAGFFHHIGQVLAQSRLASTTIPSHWDSVAGMAMVIVYLYLQLLGALMKLAH